MAFTFTKVGLTESMGSMRFETWSFTCLGTDTSGSFVCGLSNIRHMDLNLSAGTRTAGGVSASGQTVTVTVAAGPTAGTVFIIGYP